MGGFLSSVEKTGKNVVGSVQHTSEQAMQGAQKLVGGRKRRRKGGKTRRKSRGKKRTRRHPHKGQRSKTRKGRKDFITHKGDKAYNRSGHRQYRKRRPYSKRRR